MLIAMAGLPGTGKSTLARRLAERLSEQGMPAVILDKDVVRAALFPPAEVEYSTRQDDFCVGLMLQTAEYILRKGADRHVLLDGRSFSQRYQVDAVRAFARQLGTPCAFIECVCSDETVRQRLERDVAEGRHPAANRTYEMYLAVKAGAEPVSEPKLVVSTEESPEQHVRRCLEYIQSQSPMLPGRAAT
jgi:predicted kinase